ARFSQFAGGRSSLVPASARLSASLRAHRPPVVWISFESSSPARALLHTGPDLPHHGPDRAFCLTGVGSLPAMAWLAAVSRWRFSVALRPQAASLSALWRRSSRLDSLLARLEVVGGRRRGSRAFQCCRVLDRPVRLARLHPPDALTSCRERIHPLPFERYPSLARSPGNLAPVPARRALVPLGVGLFLAPPRRLGLENARQSSHAGLSCRRALLLVLRSVLSYPGPARGRLRHPLPQFAGRPRARHFRHGHRDLRCPRNLALLSLDRPGLARLVSVRPPNVHTSRPRPCPVNFMTSVPHIPTRNF